MARCRGGNSYCFRSCHFEIILTRFFLFYFDSTKSTTLVHASLYLLTLTGFVSTVVSINTNNQCQAAPLKMSSSVDVDTKTALLTAANEARGLAMDSIAAAHSGHMGLPLGCAEIGASLYGSQVRFLVFIEHNQHLLLYFVRIFLNARISGIE